MTARKPVRVRKRGIGTDQAEHLGFLRHERNVKQEENKSKYY